MLFQNPTGFFFQSGPVRDVGRYIGVLAQFEENVQNINRFPANTLLQSPVKSLDCNLTLDFKTLDGSIEMG